MGSLKTFIKSVRYSKTIADERAVIRKESASIRTAFKDVNLSNNKRRVNIQKLLYLYILGEKTHFGQIECIKLLASSNYIDKRLGYLATSLLLDENQEILTLLTNSLVQDLNHPNQFFQALALQTLASVVSYDLSNDTYNDILNILTKNGHNPYLKKKAILVSSIIIEKNPDLIEIFFENTQKSNLFSTNERDHSVLLALCQLFTSFHKFGDSFIQTTLFNSFLPKLLVILKNLTSTNYNPEYDILGISDPFLHARLLQCITLIISKPPEGSPKIGKLNDQFNDLLTQISSNVEFGKNAGNLILYEVVKSIFNLKGSNNALKVLGINLLGKFLTLKDPNIRYISLNTFLTVVKYEPKTVQRHQTIIINCLFDIDISIKRRALELIFEILNENNIRILIKELVKFLEMLNADSSYGFNEFNTFNYNLSKDVNEFSLNSYSSKVLHNSSLDNSYTFSLNNLDLKFFITTKLAIILRTYSPNLKFYFKYLIILLKLNGNYLTNDIISLILSIISNIANNQPTNIGGESNQDNQLLIKDTLNQLFGLANENLNNNGLTLITVWCLGEYSELLLNTKFQENLVVTEETILNYLSKLINTTSSQLINSYILTCLLKLTRTLTSHQSLARIESMIREFSESVNISLQTKAVEYLGILSIKDQNIKNGLLERIPAPHVKDIGKVSLSRNPANDDRGSSSAAVATNTSSNNFLLDLMDDGDSQQTKETSVNNADLLSDIFSSTTPAAPPAAPASSGILDLFDAPSSETVSTTASPSNGFLSNPQYQEIFSNAEVKLQLNIKSISADAVILEIYISSQSFQPVTDISLLVAVAKSQKLVILPSANPVSELTTDNFYKQELKITGKPGSKLRLRVKFNYSVAGSTKNVLFDHNMNKTL